MDPLGILYGMATFFGVKEVLKAAKQPLRKAAVFTTSQLFKALDRTKEAAYNMKEEFEDIVAEAQYENMKKNKGFMADKDPRLTND